MKKPAASDFPVHDLIRDRWSPRAFSDRDVPRDVLKSLFEAARWAPSCYNEQPWAYLVATRDDKESFAAKNSTPNRNAQYDTGAASALLSLEATAHGLAVHQMAGFDAEKARQVFGIPAGWEAIAALAIGYPGDPDSLPQPLREREVAPRTRKPLSEFVMAGNWGHTAPFASR